MLCLKTATVLANLLFVGQLLVLLGQDLGQVQVAHLWVDFGIFGSFLHEEAEIWRQRLLRKIWMSLNEKSGVRVRRHRSEGGALGPSVGPTEHLQRAEAPPLLVPLMEVTDQTFVRSEER